MVVFFPQIPLGISSEVPTGHQKKCSYLAAQKAAMPATKNASGQVTLPESVAQELVLPLQGTHWTWPGLRLDSEVGKKLSKDTITYVSPFSIVLLSIPVTFYSPLATTGSLNNWNLPHCQKNG